MGYLIGAYIGSRSVKAVLVDPDSAVVASAGQGCAMLHPANGWAEQDAADWQTGLTIAVRELIARPPASREKPHVTGRFRRSWQVLGSNQRRLSRRF